MSKSDDINIAYLDKLTEAVVDMTAKLDKISPSYGSNGQLEQTLRAIAKSVNNGDTTLKQMLREAANTQRNIRSVEYGVESTTKYNKTVNMFVKMLEEKLGNSKIDDVLIKKITTAFENLDVTAILESEKIGQRGGKGAPLKNVMDNEKLNRVNEDLAKRIGLSIDNAQYKLMNFFQGAGQNLKKTLKQLGTDLIEGLEKSKWVGGALRDGFRLIGLLGANWLSQFGQLGKILGASFYVAMEAFGPQLTKLLLQGIGKLLLGLPRLFGAMGGLNVAGAALGTAGAAWAFGEAKDSWQKGRKGNAVALGLGGGAMAAGAGVAGAGALIGLGGAAAGALGATGLASTLGAISAALGPIGWAVIGIGAAVAGIAALWKHHSETIKKWAGKFVSFVDKVIDFMALWNPVFKAIQWVRDFLSGNLGKSDRNDPNSSTAGLFGIGSKGAPATLLKGKTDRSGHLDLMKMTAEDWKRADTLTPTYGALGEITNLGQMSQKRAAEVIKADIAAKGTRSYYEVADQSLVDKSQFKTDVADKDNVYLVRGTSARVRSELDKLQSLGYDVSGAKITAGIGSLGSPEQMSPHRYKDSPTGHFGTTSSVDVGNIYKDGRRVDYSEYKRYLGRMAYGQSEGDHEHWAFGKFRWMEEQEKADQKAFAEQKSIAIQNAAEFVDPEGVKNARLNKALESSTGMNTELTDKEYLDILKKNKVYEDVNTNTWMRETDKGIESLWYDSTGNMQWRLLINTMQGASIGSTNGR